VPAYYLRRLGLSDEDEIPMVSMHDKVGAFQEMIEFGDGVDDGKAF
jgi:hypothetical protein